MPPSDKSPFGIEAKRNDQSPSITSNEQADIPSKENQLVQNITVDSQINFKNKKTKKDKKEDNTIDPYYYIKGLSYEGRTEPEVEILKNQIILPQTTVTYFTLFRYATKFDLFLIITSVLASIGSGAALPLFTLVMGSLTNNFSTFLTTNQGADEFQSSVNHNTLYFVYLAIAISVLDAFQTFVIVDRGDVLTARIRERYIQAILRQNIAYFDKVGPGEFTNRITSDVNLIQEGISEKLNLIFNCFATFIAAIVVGLARSWRLTLILFSVVFAIFFSMAIASVFIMKYTTASLDAFSKASSVAETILSAIRTATAFGIQSRLRKKYDYHVYVSFTKSAKCGFVIAIMVAFLLLTIYWSYGLAFWQGTRYIAQGKMDVGAMITVATSIIIGATSLGNIAPAFQSVTKSIGAAKKIYETIDRVPIIDSASDEGEVLDTFSGRIEFQNVRFAYPSRPNITVLKDFSLNVEPAQTVALVGASGSGKSTIIGIIERFYSYLGGSVKLDGVELSSLNIKWLRSQLSLVSQEPTLFSVSIFENISYGLIGTPYEHATQEEKMNLIIEACKQANAWEFIQNLPNGLDTNVGQQGVLLSGGQKQRIAIARAIVSQPKILLLDEATSALDTKSEGVVQDALDRAAADRTTIVIAHRLSTIKEADKIVVMSSGDIIEAGTHNELLEKQGAYYMLVKAQEIKSGHENQSFHSSSGKNEKSQTEIIHHEISRIDTSNTSSKSLSSEALADMAETEPLKQQKRSTIWLAIYLTKFTAGYNKLAIIGSFCGLCCGAGFPIMGYIYGQILNNVMVPPSMYDYMRHRVGVLSGYFVLLGGLEFFCFCGLLGTFTYHTSILVKRIRESVLGHYLRMDISFFDEDSNSIGALISTLSKDCQSVEGLGGVTLGQILNSLAVVIGGVIMSIVINWRLGLVCTSCVPVLVVCGFLRIYVLLKLEERAKKTYANSGQYACESVSSIRTVASLTKEELVYETYSKTVEGQVKASRAPLLRSAMFYGLSKGLVPCIMGLGFWYGSTLIRKGLSDAYMFFTAFIAVVFGAQNAGEVFSYAPSMGKAKEAAQNIARIFNVQPTIDPTSTKGDVLENVVGDIEFRDVHFRYPTRPNVPVLRGLNLTVKQGQYVALVGTSGCGKSTTISLIERFYHPLAGQVLLDGVDVTTLNIGEYRKVIGLVQQEPVLFGGTIRDNILLGLSDDQVETVDEAVIYEAAKKANIHDFIMGLPDGYDTDTGTKGTLLSGGQKQRIAIARALIRNPKVLLLDEATSALDSESEKVVQAALDAAARGRTTVAVAHRLSTIQNADVIYLFDKGVVAEQGTHYELLEKKGLYYQLVKMQALEEK